MLKRRFSLVMMILAMVIILVPFSSAVIADNENPEEMKPLSDWNGSWPSFALVYDIPELQPIFNRMTELDFEDPAAKLAENKAEYALDFDHFVVDGDKIELIKDGSTISSAVYAPISVEKTKWGKHDLYWYVYQADDAGALFKTFALMPEHGEGFRHIHFRHGNEDLAEIMAREDWWPTCYRGDMTTEDLVEYFEKDLAKKEEDAKKNMRPISDWDGNWNSAALLIAKDEAKDVLTKLAELDGKTYDESLAEMKDRYAADFDTLMVADGVFTFAKDGKEVSGKYESLGVKKFKNGRSEQTWHVLKAVDDSAPYPVIISFAPHGDPPHIHFRYAKNGESIQDLLAMTKWMPTVYADDVSIEDFVESREKRLAKAQKNAEAKVELSQWAGLWNNMGEYLNDEELQPAFVTLGENEKISAEDAKKAYVEKRRCDFGAISFEGDEVIFFDKSPDRGGVEYARGKYEYSSVETSKYGNHDLTWYVFKTSDAAAPYTYLVMMEVHGDELTHFHLRYGDESVSKLLKIEGWFPTMIAPDSTVEELIAEITE